MTDTALALSPSDRLDVGSVVSRTLIVIRRNLPIFLLLTAICAFLPGVITGAVNYKANSTTFSSMNFVWDQFTHPVNRTSAISALNANTFWLILLGALGGLYLQAAVVGRVAAEIDGRAVPTLGEAWRHVLPLLGIFIVVYVPCVIGLIFLVVPGVILFLTFSVAGPVRVAEERGVFGSIQRSRDLTRGLRLKILLIMILFFVAELLVGSVAGAIKVVLHVPTEIWGISMAPAIGAALALVRTVGLAVIYVGLRAAKEGGAAVQVAEAFA